MNLLLEKFLLTCIQNWNNAKSHFFNHASINGNAKSQVNKKKLKSRRTIKRTAMSRHPQEQTPPLTELIKQPAFQVCLQRQESSFSLRREYELCLLFRLRSRESSSTMFPESMLAAESSRPSTVLSAGFLWKTSSKSMLSNLTCTMSKIPSRQ